MPASCPQPFIASCGRIWALSMEPRRVPVGGFPLIRCDAQPSTPPPAPPPATLHVCVESRSYLERYYVRAFAEESHSPARYTWINFDVDTVCIRQRSVERLCEELLPARHLSVDGNDGDWFYYNAKGHVANLPLLEDLEIRCVLEAEDWWAAWTTMMLEFYYTDMAKPFRSTVISPIPDHHVLEFTPDNYIKVEHDARKRMMAEHPEFWTSDAEMSDLDDDVDAPGRFHTWEHAPYS